MGKFLSNQQAAAALIAKFGGQAVLTRRTPGMLDPVTQVRTGASETPYTVLAATMPAGQHAQYIAGTMEKRAALEAYVSLKGLAIVPEPGDALTVGGAIYKVFWVKTYDPASDGPIFSHAYLEA